MGEVYVFAPSATEFDSMGLCGALVASSCIHTEEANGLSEIKLNHPIDPNGRWTFLQNDYILKCDVPVRTVPPITQENTLVTSHEVWTIRTATTKAQRRLYYNASGNKARRKLDAGTKLPIIYKGENRFKAIYTKLETYRDHGKKKTRIKTYYGWVDKSAIEYTLTDANGWVDDPAAIETVAPAWRVIDQLFRIYKTDIRDDGVTICARHIFYDLLGNLTTYEVANPTCGQAVNGIIENSVTKLGFTGYTNLADQRVVEKWTRVNPVSALLDPETGVVPLWGGEFVRDNYDFYVLKEAGLNRGVRIEYEKNLLGVSCEVDMSDVVTRVIPVGKDKKGKDMFLVPGIYKVDGQNVVIAENTYWLDSPHILNYPTPHIHALECSGQCKESGSVSKAMARTRMVREAQDALENDADLPAVSLKVEFVALGGTEEYDQFQRLEDVFLYDRVLVKHSKIGVEVLCKVNRVEFDCLREQFQTIELGSVRKDMSRSAVASWQIPPNINGRKIVSESISSAHLQADAGIALDLTDNDSVTNIAQQTVGITVSILPSRGIVLNADVPETVLTAQVKRGATDLTDSYDAAQFSWARVSDDSSGDSEWNATHRGMKSITVSAADVKRQAVFHCTLEEV